ncbi:redoxin domain-containing protein [Candidatus Saccharibacteria bacterium]|nr:redoxin domain-containing protein [Candidatus Saccharibacteria bacterium]
MSKRLIILLLLIAGLMFAGASLTDKGSNNSGKKGSAVPQSLNDMIGRPAPDFSLTSYDGKLFALSQQRGKKVILFFNEGIMCYPACWNQMAALGTDGQLNSEKVVSVSIVTDESDEWKMAVKKMPELGKGTILMDSDRRVSNQYGMLSLASSMHKGTMPGHTYLIVDEQGVVRYTLDDPKMGVQNDVLVSELAKI